MSNNVNDTPEENLLLGADMKPTKDGLHLNLLSGDSVAKQWNRAERNIWTTFLCAGSAALYCCRTTMPLCVVSIENNFHWTKRDAGTILSSFFWGYSMTQIFGGWLSDRVGGDRVMLAAAFIWSLLTFWTPVFLHFHSNLNLTFAVLIFSRVVVGAAQGVHYPSGSSLVAEKVADQDRTWVFTCLLSGSHLGTILAGLLGSFILERFGWEMVFHLMGVFGITWALSFRYMMHKRRQQSRILSLRSNFVSETNAHVQKTNSVPWIKLFSSVSFWSIVIGHFTSAYCFFILYSWIPTYFHEHYPDAKGWVYNVLPYFGKFVAVLFSGWLGDKLLKMGNSVEFTRKLLETISGLGGAFFLICLSSSTSYYGALLCVVGILMSLSFHNSGVMCNPHDIAPRYAGSVFGIMNMGAAIPGFIGVYITGYILNTTQSWAFVFNSTAVIVLIGLVTFIIFGTGKKIVD